MPTRKKARLSSESVAPAAPTAPSSGGAIPRSRQDMGGRFARTTAPRELDDPERRKQWGLPPLDQPGKPGHYIVELNAEHASGLNGARLDFLTLYKAIVTDAGAAAAPAAPATQPDRREPVQIAKSYFWCRLLDHEWRALIRDDETKSLKQRAIYRLWPDFPVKAHTDKSTCTIKSDAALRSFAAAGNGVTWAVIDSGVDAGHRHFGPPRADGDDEPLDSHLLWSADVRDLHRCFADISEIRDGEEIELPPLADPDALDQDKKEDRDALIREHRHWALCDDFGHGTHVAGIIAGDAPRHPEPICALERQFRLSDDGSKLDERFEPRAIAEAAPRPRGVAPQCKLISLRVLDRQGNGRSSRVIQALEYIRNHINDNPKLMRVHGVNLSVGYEFDAEMFACGQSPLCTAVDRLVQEGVVVVAAAGNTGYGPVMSAAGATRMGFSNSINDPGNAASAITVGATHRDAPHTYGVSYFSSKGPTGDGRLKPDLVAPGERITSCAAGSKLDQALRLNTGADARNPSVCYIDDSGTSMAAPHVSGAIAAFLSIRREFIGKPQEVKRIFLDSATPLGRERYFEGHGLVDLMRAIQSI